MKRPQAHLSVNFGQRPFAFDIDSMMAVRTGHLLAKAQALTSTQSEKSSVFGDIRATSVAKLHSTSDESVLMKELVAQYLVHDGYIETAKAFAAEVQTETTALGGTTTINGPAMEDDLDASNRQSML